MKSVIAVAFIMLGILFWIQSQKPEELHQPISKFEQSQSQSNNLTIPTLEMSAPIVFLHSIKESDIQNALQKGVVHYYESALPGKFGNAYIVGHSSDLPWSEGEYKNIFSRLIEMNLGDKIEISYQGDQYIYEVIETKIVDPDDFSVLDQPFDKKLLSLQTSYPIGTALKRFIVISKLIE